MEPELYAFLKMSDRCALSLKLSDKIQFGDLLDIVMSVSKISRFFNEFLKNFCIFFTFFEYVFLIIANF